MSNQFRVLLTAASREREVLHRFVGGLVTDGWYAHAPVGNLNPNPDVIDPEMRTWGGYLYPDLRIMTKSETGSTRTFSSTDAKCLPDFASADCVEQYKYMLNGHSYPGLALESIDSLAIVMGEARCSPPHQWATTVIDRYFDTGLRFFIVCYDLSEVGYSAEPRRFVFYSAAAEQQEFKISQHCAGLELSSTDSSLQ